MRFFSLFAPVIAAFVAVTSAASTENAITYPYSGITLDAGRTIDIKWNPTTTGPVTIKLRSGASNNLDEGMIIGDSIPNTGSFSYPIPRSMPYSAYYTIQIIPVSDPSEYNFSAPFVIDSSNMAPVSSASLAVMTSTSGTAMHTVMPHTKPAQHRVKLAKSRTTSANIAGVTMESVGGAVGLEVRGGIAAMMAVGAGVAFAL